MPTTYPGIPALTDGPSGRQIIPIIVKDADGTKTDVGYLLRWTPQDEADSADPDGVWDSYLCTATGPDKLLANGDTREGAARVLEEALRSAGVIGC